MREFLLIESELRKLYEFMKGHQWDGAFMRVDFCEDCKALKAEGHKDTCPRYRTLLYFEYVLEGW